MHQEVLFVLCQVNLQYISCGRACTRALSMFLCSRQAKKELQVSYTVEFIHVYLTQPTIIPEYRILHAIHFLFSVLKDVPFTLCDSQLAAIDAIQNIFKKWSTNEKYTLP